MSTGDVTPLLARLGPDDDSIAMLGVDGGDESLVMRLYADSGSDLKPLGPDSVAALSFGWFPDGETLFLSTEGVSSGSDPEPADFWIVSLDGNLEQLQNDLDLDAGYDFVDVDEARGRVYFAGSEPTVLGSPTDLYWLDLASGHTTQITDTPRFETHALVADEDRIVYLGLGLEVLDTRSGAVTTLSTADQAISGIDLTSSRDWVVYAAWQGNDRDTNAIWYVPVDGSEPPVRLMGTEGLRPSMSSDGRHLLVDIPGEGPGQQGSLEWLEVPSIAPWLDG